MNPLLAAALVVALVAVATAIGLFWRARTGRIRESVGPVVTPASLGTDARFGSDATIVQFSTEYCGPCRQAERILERVASERAGVAYLDVDLTAQPHLANEYGVMQTPTILLLDAAGGIRSRIGGVPRQQDVAQRLDEIVKESHVGVR